MGSSLVLGFLLSGKAAYCLVRLADCRKRFGTQKKGEATFLTLSASTALQRSPSVRQSQTATSEHPEFLTCLNSPSEEKLITYKGSPPLSEQCLSL